MTPQPILWLAFTAWLLANSAVVMLGPSRFSVRTRRWLGVDLTINRAYHVFANGLTMAIVLASHSPLLGLFVLGVDAVMLSKRAGSNAERAVASDEGRRPPRVGHHRSRDKQRCCSGRSNQ